MITSTRNQTRQFQVTQQQQKDSLGYVTSSRRKKNTSTNLQINVEGGQSIPITQPAKGYVNHVGSPGSSTRSGVQGTAFNHGLFYSPPQTSQPISPTRKVISSPTNKYGVSELKMENQKSPKTKSFLSLSGANEAKRRPSALNGAKKQIRAPVSGVPVQ